MESSYIFNPKELSTEALWDIIRDFQILQRDKAIGDCALREIASKEVSESFVLTGMVSVALRAMEEVLYRESPERFEVK